MKYLLLGMCMVGIAACSGKPAPAEPKPAAQVSTPFDTLRASEQRAKDVQKIVNDAAAKQRKAIDQGPQ